LQSYSAINFVPFLDHPVYNSVSIACVRGRQAFWKTAFFPRLVVGRWFSNIGVTGGPP